jgi:prepilin-type N-terminal cleavage/methylation domain-containing protein
MKSESGFSLVELLVAMTVMLLISGAAFTAIMKLGTTQSTIWNRTQMHSGIRGATEVLQQEVGQAGRIALISGSATCTNDTAVPCLTSVTGTYPGGTLVFTVSSICGMFIGENLVLDVTNPATTPPATPETITIAQINGGGDPTSTQCPTASTILGGSITAQVATTYPHSAGAPLQALGGFVAGIVPTTTTNGSTSSILKLFGDINGDGNMVYTEYSVQPSCICSASCNPGTMTGNLYRNSMSWNAAAPKTQASASQILLGNVTANPNGSACFSYQQQTTASGDTFVTDVAVTLTVQTQLIDPITNAFQTETKALLNVSPRNVFNTWELVSNGYTDRKQATPGSITALLAGPP